MGTIKKVGEKSYSQNANGDWYEVESPVQQEPENAKVLNGITYYKDDAGNWYEGGKVSQKKNDGQPSKNGGQEQKPSGKAPSPSPSPSPFQDDKSKTREQIAREDFESGLPFLTEKIKINQPGDIMTGQQRNQMAASKVKADKIENYRTQVLPQKVKEEKEKAKQASLKPEVGEQFNPVDFATNDIATYSGGASLNLDPKAPSKDKFNQLNQFFGNDASNVAPYFDNRVKAVDSQIAQIKQNPMLWRSLNQGKNDLAEIEKLKDYKLKLAAASNKLATDYTAWLYPDAPLEKKGQIKRKLAGDDSVNQEIAFKEKGIPLTDEQKFNNAKQGIDVERTRLENDYRDVPPDQRDDAYYQRLAQVDNMDETLLNQFPDYKKSQVGMMVAQLASQDPNIDASSLIGFIPQDLDQKTINYISEKYKIPKEDLQGLQYGDIPDESILSNVRKGALGLTTGFVTGATRILGSAMGVDSDRLTYVNNKISALPDYIAGNNPYQKTTHPQSIVDINPTSSTYLQNIPNPKAGKSNYNLTTVSHSIATGATEFAAFMTGLELTTLAVKGGAKLAGVALTAEAAQSAAMTTYMVVHNYENNWQRGNEVMGEDASEVGKAMYATLSGYIDKLAFDVLPKDKLFLSNQTKAAINKELSPYLKDLTIKNVNKEVLQTKVQKVVQGLINTSKEVGHITAAMDAAAISKAIVNSVVGKDEPKKYFEEAWHEVKQNTVEIPLTMGLPLGVMEVVKAKQHSSFFKENVYSAGLEPNKYIALIQQELGKGNLTPEEANSRMEVVKTMHNIVQSTPDINPLTNKPFTHNQQVEYAYNRLKESGLRAKALAHAEDPAIASIYLRDAQDLADVRKAMLKSFSNPPKQAEAPKEKTIPQQKVDIERQRQDELEKTPEDADKINAKYDAEITKLSEQEELPSEKTIEEIIPKEQLDKTQSIMDRVANNENINEGEIKEAEDILYTALADNPKLANLIEPLILKLQNHENVTKTETVQTTERKPIEGTLAAKRKVEIKPALEQSEGSTARVVLADGTTGEGTLRIVDGNYVIEVEGQEPIVVGEKAITDRDLKVPEGESPVELDENGNVKSATFETKDGHKVTITDPEKALDLGIQLSLETVGEIPDEAFDRVYEDVIKEDKIEVPVEKPKVEKKVETEAEVPEQKEETVSPEEADIESRRQKELDELKDTLQVKPIEVLDEKGNVISTTDKAAEINAKYDAELKALKEKQKSETPQQKEIERLRAEEQAEYDAMPDPKDEAKRKEIYDKYDKLISPLLKEGEPKVEVPKQKKKQPKGKAAKFVAENLAEPAGEGEGEPKPEPPTKEKTGEEILKELEDKGTKSSDEKSLKELADKNKGNKVKRKIIEQARKAIKTLKSIFPNMDIHLHENEQEYNDVMEKVKGKQSSGGNFAYTKNADGTYSARIDINLNAATSTTVAHEVTHAILFKAFGENQEVFQSFRDKISKVLGSATEKGLKDFADSPFYKAQGVTAEEYLSELSGLLSSKTINPLTLSKIASAINEFVSKVTGGKFIPFENVNDAKDVIEFFDNVSKAIKKGNDLTNIGKEKLVENAETQARIKSKSQTEKLFKADKDEIEKILDKAGKNKEGKKWKLSDVATVISKYIDKKKVFDKPIEEVSDKEFVSGIKKETDKELKAWEESVGGKEYVSFYKNDITDRLNPKLQQFAEKRYGRKLTPEEISLYHLVSAFASPEATPEFDSSKGLEVFDKYMKTGNLSGLSDKQATIWALNEKGVKEDTGVPKFAESGEPVMSKWSKGYADYSLDKFKNVIDYFNGDLGKAIEWAQSIHSYEEISNVMGIPLKGDKALKPHENLTKQNGGFGIFGFTGAKLGSYALNRMGEYSTVTKDMWYARTMARLSGESMFDEKGDAVKKPWAFTVEDVRKRKLADKAWEEVAKKKGLSPSDIQERMWDYEKRLWEKLGAVESASYASDGFMKQAKVFEPDIKFTEPAPEQKIKSKSRFEEEKGLPLTDETKKYEQQPKSRENPQGREGLPKSITAGKEGAGEERPRNAESYSNPDGTPQYVVKRSDRDGGKRLDINVNGTPSKAKAVYTQSEQLKSAVNNYRNAYTDKNLIELDDANLFHKLITQSKSINKFGASVHVYEPGEYAQMRLFITPDGKAGVALKPDGDLVSGFSNQEVDKPRRIAQLLGLAIKEGAIKADSFDTVLPQYYIDFGLLPVAQDKWNEEFKPEKWDKEVFKQWNNGEPDVIYYVYKGGDRSTISERAGEFGSWKDLKKDVPYAEYDDAVKIQQQSIKSKSQLPEQVEDTAKALENVGENTRDKNRIATDAGLIIHAGESKIDKLDTSKAKGGARGIYGKGIYFSDNPDKAADYGGEFTFLDKSKLSIIDTRQKISKEFIDSIKEVSKKVEEEGSPIRALKYNMFADKLKAEINGEREIDNAWKNVRDRMQADQSDSWNALLKDLGYDTIKNGYEYVVFDAEKGNAALVKDSNAHIAEAYHKGDNPKLTKSVNELLGVSELPQQKGVGEVDGIAKILEEETPILSTPKTLSTKGLPNLDIVPSKEASSALESEIGGDKGVINKDIRTIPIQEYDVTENNRSRQIAEQIQDNGWIEPLIVSYDKNGDVYIVEGQHRAAALKELGYDKAPVVVIYDKTKLGVSELPKQEGVGEAKAEIMSKSQMPMDKKISDMKDILKEYVDEGKSLDEIKDILKDEFGDYYNDVEKIIIQAHQEMTTTSIKNAVTERERGERGLEEIEVEAKRSFGKVFDDAKQMIANGVANGLTLAAEIIKNPRPLKAEESAVLLIDRMRISNEYNKKNAELLEAQENGETSKADIIQSQMEALEEEMDLNDEAARKSGYEQGLGLAARRMLIAQDYSLVTQMNRLKAANAGKEVPKQYQEQLKSLITQLEEANNKLDKLEKTQAGTEKQTGLSKVAKVSRTPEQFEKEKQSIKSKIATKWGQTLTRMKSVIKGRSQIVSKSAVTPQKQAQLESIVKDVNDMVKLYAESGITDLKKIIDNVHQDLSNSISGIDRVDVEDIVLGKYDTQKPKTPLTPAKIQAQANVRKVKTQIDMLKEELKNKQRGGVEKAVDYLHGWHRFAILSGVPSAAKISTAALTRGIVTRGENIVGQALSLIPGIRKVAKQAPREGGFNMKAESKAFSSWFDKMTRDDMAEVMNTGISQIDYLYGAKEPKGAKVPEWMEWFGRMHSAIKLLPKRAEFFRSLEMRTEQALKEGKNINDVVVQQELGVAAYNDALRSIFMQDNILTENYQAAIRKYEETQPTTASLLKFLFPIVKVPSNYVAEQSSYIPVVAAVKAITALYKGRKGMTPEQADFFMRALKKGSIGAAFIALGFFNPVNFGGYYTGKRKKDDLEAGDIELFGVKLPHFMLHTPLLEMLQVGSTMRRAAESQLAKGEEPSKTLGMYTGGIPAVLKGQLTQIPFIGTGERTMKLLENKTADGIKEFGNSMVQSVVEPQLMQNLADFIDREEGKTVKRESKGLVEKLKEGTPGLRQTLKQDKAKFTDKEYEEFSNITEKGLNIPELNKRTTYKVKIDTEHPDGHMTEEEYDKFIPLQKEYVKDAYKKFYGSHKSDFDKLQKMIDAVPETSEEKAKMNSLKDAIQNKIDAVHNEAIKAAKRKVGLTQK